MTEAVATQSRAIARLDELSVEDVVAQVEKIQHIMHRAMKAGEHYGVIPGTNSKPSLLKPGAEKLCLTFRLDPQYSSTEQYDGPHLTVKSTCTLYYIPAGLRLGSGEGSCSTKESKYAFRYANRTCPKCGKEAIIQGKAEYGGGWVCFKKKDGCGTKFKDGDTQIETQVTGRVANDALADQYNTILKMSNKRALVAAVLNVTAASDIFTQDLEDLPTSTGEVVEGEVTSAAPPPPPQPSAESEEREHLIADIKRLADKSKLSAKDRATFRDTYLGGSATLEAANLAALADLHKVLLARAGE